MNQRSSSTVLLTATVAKEVKLWRFYMKAAALVLADNIICSIGEFEKRNVRDEVSIHEAMEQNWLSITKAGNQATSDVPTINFRLQLNPIGGCNG